MEHTLYDNFEVLLASPKGFRYYGLDYSYDVLEHLIKSAFQSLIQAAHDHKLASAYEQVKSANRGFGTTSSEPVRKLTSLNDEVLASRGPWV